MTHHPASACRWVIRLEGGGWCYDQATCVLRYSAQPNLMSSALQYYPNTLGGGAVLGVLDGDPRANPNMNLWNHVSIGYCSSDSYLGEAAPGEPRAAQEGDSKGCYSYENAIFLQGALAAAAGGPVRKGCSIRYDLNALWVQATRRKQASSNSGGSASSMRPSAACWQPRASIRPHRSCSQAGSSVAQTL